MTTTKPTYMPLLPRVVEVGSLYLKLGRTPCVLAGLWFRAMRRHALLPHDVSDSVASSLSTLQGLSYGFRCLAVAFPNGFDGLMVSPFLLSCSSVLVNHFGLGSERGQLCVSREWVRFFLYFPPHPCFATMRYHPTAATNRVGDSVAATMLLSMSTAVCGLRSPHKYRIRVTYSAVAIRKELLGVVAKPFCTGQEVPVRESTLASRYRVSLSGWVSASSH